MKRTAALIIVLSFTTSSFLAWAGSDAVTPSAEQLIEKLGSNNFAEREQAAKTLQVRGPVVLPALRKALKHEDAEVRKRVAELIPILEHVAAVAPKRVTLSGEKRPLSAILKDIEKQTGYTVEAEEFNNQEQIAVELKDVPFWEALERIRRAVGCIVVAGETAKEIRLRPSKTGAPFVVAADSFRLELTHIHEERDSNFRQAGHGKELGGRQYRVELAVSVLPEPKYLIVGVDAPQVEKAHDENGKPLSMAPALDKQEMNVFQFAKATRKLFVEIGAFEQAEIRLQRSEPNGKWIKEVRGNVPVHVVVARKNIVATDKFLNSTGTTLRIGNDTLEIIAAEQLEGGGYHLNIMVPKPDALSLNWDDRIYLEDAKGNRYKRYSTGSNQQGDKYSVDYGYAKSTDPAIGPPVKVIIEDWTILRHSIPFVFKDIPLP